MQVLKRVGVTILFGVLTVCAAIGFSLHAWLFLSVLGSDITFYERPHGIAIVAALIAAVISLAPAAFDRGLWWVAKISTFILAGSLIIAPVTFFILAYEADASAFNRERLDVIVYFGMPIVVGFVAALVVLLFLGIAALVRWRIKRRQRAAADPALAFD